MDAKLSMAKIDDEIIAPALWLVGDLWERGDISIHETQHVWRGAGYEIGGRGLTSRLYMQPGISVCTRVTEAVETVDAMARRAGMNWQEGSGSHCCVMPRRRADGTLRE